MDLETSALPLLREADRLHSTLTPYNDALTRSVLREINAHDAYLVDNTDGPQEEKHIWNMHGHSALYKRRCLLSYNHHRAHLIRQIYWQAGTLPQNIKERMSLPEVTYFNEYEELMERYKRRFDCLDLLSSPEPPRELFIEVRVLKDVGEIWTENGRVMLLKGAQLLLMRRDVEKLIMRGLLEQI